MTEAGINGRLDRDLYVSLGNMVSDNAWSLRIYDKPLIRLIWVGTIFMMLGAIFSIKYKKVKNYMNKKLLSYTAVFIIISLFLFEGLYYDPKKIQSPTNW